ncbi:fused (3R)-hydroxyacyl-ACP dehydratase subunits HadA/HadB [Nocardia sp. CDC153]|uniref:fused (3R)-hydroxyacyl-ACP dehydratase subunits HadA/HadB n=1 Tax=Nocardia sp. CDC153 TaxID=3112167 RepID=UPI002DBE1856|nr:fused (3R)-hydroxyacyl-ACP dehydratase subunits HadA/HadB [Nocardia sp. CDC153]MEC3953772.1 fused (3R)-hydroxyacyl-ACP dehydratase subunits HadA/HadB [Nocardia sp. CDC153]
MTFDPIAHATSMVGRRFQLDGYYEVGREKVREYAAAVQDEHPVHWDERAATELGYPTLPASPTFLSMLAPPVQHAMSGMLTGYDLRASVQTDQVMDFHRPVMVGDRVTSNVALKSFRQAFGGDMFVFENVITDQHGEAVLTGTTSVIARSEQSDEHADAHGLIGDLMHRGMDTFIRRAPRRTELIDWAPTVAAYRSSHSRAAGTLAAGDELPCRTVLLTVGDLVRYAGVAGDANPIHWHAGAARAVGLERGVVAHGMLTMAYGAGFVTSWLGDPGALEQYSVRMSNPVYVTETGPTAIEFSGKVKSVDERDGTATVAISATHEGRKIFGRATAIVQLA